MCCSLSISPLDQDIATALLTIGLFLPTFMPPTGGAPIRWERMLEEEGTSVAATFSVDSLDLHISPSISVYAQHANKRHAAGVFFELAAKYAERVQGTIVQHANIGLCKAELDGQGDRLLATYPLQRLDFLQICPGFRELFISPLE